MQKPEARMGHVKCQRSERSAERHPVSGKRHRPGQPQHGLHCYPCRRWAMAGRSWLAAVSKPPSYAHVAGEIAFAQAEESAGCWPLAAGSAAARRTEGGLADGPYATLCISTRGVHVPTEGSVSRTRPPTGRDQEYELHAARSPGLSARGSKTPGLITALVSIWRMGQTAPRRAQRKHHLGAAHKSAALPTWAHRHFNGGRSGRSGSRALRLLVQRHSGGILVLECVSDLQQVLAWAAGASDNCASHHRASTSGGVASCSNVATASVRESGSWAAGPLVPPSGAGRIAMITGM